MNEQTHPVNDLMSSTMEELKNLAGANAIVGQPIEVGEVTLIPVSKVSAGFASGGTDFTGKNAKPDRKNHFGGGAGAGVNISPVAFLVVKGGSVRLLPVAPPPATTVDRVVEMVPELIDKVSELIEKKQNGDSDLI